MTIKEERDGARIERLKVDDEGKKTNEMKMARDWKSVWKRKDDGRRTVRKFRSRT